MRSLRRLCVSMCLWGNCTYMIYKIKICYLLLLCLCCFSCINRRDEKAILLNKRLGAVCLLSSASDSLLHEVESLLPHQQVEILLNVSSNNEMTSLGTEKQEQLLLKAFNIASKQEQKRILQRLIILYQKLDQWGISDATSKGIKRCEELETQYSLSKEEYRNLRRIKANLLNRQGSYKESISILYILLEEDREAEKVEYVIEDLYTIATYFIRLGDLETGLMILNDIYNQTVTEELTEQQFIYLSSIVGVSFDLKRYGDVDSICNKINLDSLSHYTSSSIYLMLAKSNLQLQKTDKARFYLHQMNQKSQIGTGMIFYCRMAETYIAENREDSAAFYLNEALKAKGILGIGDKRIENLPLYFMYVYPSYASLLQHNGKLQQAQEAFRFVEPLMKTPVFESERLEVQIEALGLYSDFCRLTKQYAKATELLVYRDSIQKIYYEDKISLDSKHWVDRFEIQELTNKNAKQADEINNAKRILSIFIVVSIIILFLCGVIVYLYKLTRKQYKKLFENKQQGTLGHIDLSSQSSPETSKKRKPLTPQEKCYRKARKMVESQKLYLNNALTLEVLAEMVGTNRSTLSACINQFAKVNFNQWINDYRINHVKRCMTPATNLSEIYKEVGFKSYNTFNNSFKKRVGCTPYEYIQTLTAEEFQDMDTMT